MPDDWSDSEDAADDPEGPQSIDLDHDDDDEPAIPCPNCRRLIHESAECCPWCGEWVIHAHTPAAWQRPWLLVVAILLLLSFLFWVL